MMRLPGGESANCVQLLIQCRTWPAAAIHGLSLPKVENLNVDLRLNFLCRADWRTFTCFISIVQVIMFIVTLIVGATMFDGSHFRVDMRF